MSRQSKQAKKFALAKSITDLHLKGEKGASATTPCHGKKWTYRGNPEIMKRLAEALAAPVKAKRGLETVGAAAE
jgi:hypothetical protein